MSVYIPPSAIFNFFLFFLEIFPYFSKNMLFNHRYMAVIFTILNNTCKIYLRKKSFFARFFAQNTVNITSYEIILSNNKIQAISRITTKQQTAALQIMHNGYYWVFYEMHYTTTQQLQRNNWCCEHWNMIKYTGMNNNYSESKSMPEFKLKTYQIKFISYQLVLIPSRHWQSSLL